jgi:hypothetical protein
MRHMLQSAKIRLKVQNEYGVVTFHSVEIIPWVSSGPDFHSGAGTGLAGEMHVRSAPAS